MMKKLLNLILTIGIVFTSFIPIHADNNVITVEIPVEIEGEGKVVITGERNLPETTTLTESGKFTLTFNNPEPGDVYVYEVRQIAESDKIIYDDTVYGVRVYISYEKDSDKLYGTVIINKGDDTQKPDECHFINTPKKGDVMVVYKVEGTGTILKSLEYVIHQGDIDTPYSTEELAFEGYEFVRMDENSAPRSGLVKEETQTVIYLYRQKRGNVFVVYKTEDGQILKELENICPDYVIGTPYSTEELSFDGYVFSRMDPSSAPKSGQVMETDQTVIYLYKKKPTPIIPPEIITPVRKFVSTGAGKAVIVSSGVLIASVIAFIIINKKKKKEEKK